MTPRPLSADQLYATGLRLQAIANELLADHAGAVQRNLAAAADPTPWPTSTGGAGNGQGGGSPVEQAIGLNRPDDQPMIAVPPITARAARLLDALHAIMGIAVTVDHGLHEWSPNRVIAVYPACGHPINRAYTRCQAIVDGVQCAAGATTPKPERRCETCDKLMPPGKALDNGECNTCAKYRRRKGRARIATSRLALAQGLVTEEGTYVEAAGNAT